MNKVLEVIECEIEMRGIPLIISAGKAKPLVFSVRFFSRVKVFWARRNLYNDRLDSLSRCYAQTLNRWRNKLLYRLETANPFILTGWAVGKHTISDECSIYHAFKRIAQHYYNHIGREVNPKAVQSRCYKVLKAGTILRFVNRKDPLPFKL